MRLKQYLRTDFVLADLDASDVEGVVEEVAIRAGELGVGPSEEIREKLLERERVHPTVLGQGLAIPHATVPGLDAPVLGIALAREPIAFGPAELDPVRVFFVLLTPPGFEREHVKLLARICRLARHDDFMERLEGAGDEEELAQIIEEIDSEHV